MDLSRYPKYNDKQECFLEFMSIRRVSVAPPITTPRERSIQEQTEQGMLDLMMEFLGGFEEVSAGVQKATIPVRCYGCYNHIGKNKYALVIPVWAGLWVCPECNNRLELSPREPE